MGRLISGFNDLSSQNPEIAKEWHPTKNGSLTPEYVTKSSGKKVWWQCSKNIDHVWKSIVQGRKDVEHYRQFINNGDKQPRDYEDRYEFYKKI